MKIISSPISSPDIFDYQLRRMRNTRYDAADDFLCQRALAGMLDRLSFIKRQFSNVLLVGPKADQLQGAECLPFMASDDLLSQVHRPPYDLVVMLNMHWVNDLPGVLAQIRQLLKPDGLFLGALLGGDTLHELRASFAQAEMTLYSGLSPRVVPMVDLYSASQLLLRADLRLPVADREVITATYSSVRALGRDLRRLGQTNIMRVRNPLMSRSLLEQTESIYRQNHSTPDGRLLATYEMIYLTGWAYHESQPTALKPGSASASLITALS